MTIEPKKATRVPFLMRKSIATTGLLAFAAGFAVHLAISHSGRGPLSIADHWKLVNDYRTFIRDPKNYKPDPRTGLSAADVPFDLEPSLAALVSAGELEHIDIILPRVPKSREINRYWMRWGENHDDVVEMTGDHSYSDYQPSGDPPLHLNLWFKSSAKKAVQQLIKDLEAYTPAVEAEKVVAGWANQGMWLPGRDEVALFTDNFEKTQGVLGDALNATNSAIRNRAAYVIEKIGPGAFPLKAPLVAALVQEQDSLVRVSFCNALRAIKSTDADVMSALRQIFEQKNDDQQTRTERIYAAAALFVLNQDPAERDASENYVCRWIRIPDATISGQRLEDEWDLCWSAVIAVEHMTGTTKAPPLLQGLLDAPSRKLWIDIHVPRALAALTDLPNP